eukprot:1363874-Rhodomonas_salina.1
MEIDALLPCKELCSSVTGTSLPRAVLHNRKRHCTTTLVQVETLRSSRSRSSSRLAGPDAQPRAPSN